MGISNEKKICTFHSTHTTAREGGQGTTIAAAAASTNNIDEKTHADISCSRISYLESPLTVPDRLSLRKRLRTLNWKDAKEWSLCQGKRL